MRWLACLDEEALWNHTESLLPIQSQRLDVRRTLIRMLTCLSEANASLGSNCHRDKKWSRGAKLYTASLKNIHEAIDYADSQIFRYLSLQTMHMSDDKVDALKHDANIVEVAIDVLTQNREEFLNAARQEEYLQNTLVPLRASRDAIKKKMGERWYSKSKGPISSVAKSKLVAEMELKEIRMALQCL